MKSRYASKVLAAALALTLAAGVLPVSPLELSGAVLPTSANGDLPVVPATETKYTFTNNTEYVTATWNSQSAASGQELNTGYPLVLTAERPFIYKVGTSSTVARKNSQGVYKVSLNPGGNVTVDSYYAEVEHDNGFARKTSIYLKADSFNHGDSFYYDTTFPAGTVKTRTEGDKVWYSNILNVPTELYTADGELIVPQMSVKNGVQEYAFTPAASETYYLVRAFVEGSESNWDGNATPVLPFGDVDTVTVKHDNGSGAEEDLELIPENFNQLSSYLSTDKAFAEGDLVNVQLDASTATGLVMTKPGVKIKVYTTIWGDEVEVTKLANSDIKSTNYTFPVNEVYSYFIVKEYAPKIINGKSIAIGEKIELRFFVDSTNDIVNEEGAYIMFSIPGLDDVTMLLTDYKIQSNRWYYGCELGPSRINDDITATICHADGTAIDSLTYSIAAYAEYLKGYLPNNQKIQNLMNSMLRYGAAAQIYKGYNTDKLPINDLSTVFASNADIAAAISNDHVGQPSGTVSGVTFAGATASLGSDCMFSCAFNVTGNLKDYTFTYKNTVTGEAKKAKPTLYAGTIYLVNIPGVVPSRYDTIYEFTVKNKKTNDTMTVQRSLFGYVKSMMTSASATENLRLLLKSMYYYNLAVKAYKTN
ncbi:MAG: hypothetical protein IKN17_10465 [Ruminococcus sp.]|nr:hypothetical protein [Ruminococcus sp.]